MAEIKTGTCHCGAVEFKVSLPGRLKDVRRCNCSICRRKGAVMVGVPLAALQVTRGADNLNQYRWNTRVAEHYFCRTCGIYTHHVRRSNPNHYGVNVGCLHGVDVYALGDIAVGDGKSMSVAAAEPARG